jgi:hypothetical protein
VVSLLFLFPGVNFPIPDAQAAWLAGVGKSLEPRRRLGWDSQVLSLSFVIRALPTPVVIQSAALG